MPYNLPQRKSPRAKWHDYNGAKYFVTFCTKNREFYFGNVVDGQMELSEIGEWAHQCIEKIETINNNVFIPKYVVMPNHIHMIVIMDNQRLPRCDSPTSPVADNATNGKSVGLSYHGSRETVPEINVEMQRRSNCCGRLSHIIGRFKSAVTKYANEHNIPFAWQPRYHDHILRNQMEMNQIADYIENNPSRWEMDRFYK